jgi:hypothetical protein
LDGSGGPFFAVFWQRVGYRACPTGLAWVDLGGWMEESGRLLRQSDTPPFQAERMGHPGMLRTFAQDDRVWGSWCEAVLVCGWGGFWLAGGRRTLGLKPGFVVGYETRG